MDRWTRGPLAIVLALAAALLVAPAAPAAGQPSQAAAPTAGGLRWGPCPEPSPAVAAVAAGRAQQPLALECALLRVPLDYRHPDGRSIEIAVSRLRTSTPALRRGVLLLNPGGPGGPGLDLPLFLAQVAPPEVLQRYDLIGFDPRFVGRSTPISCRLVIQRVEQVVPWPLPGGVRENAELARATAAACASAAGQWLPHVTTANTARDMDRIRAALGERRISYLGYSYGTYLGAVYASLFPTRTDRLVLDSAVDPHRVWREVFRLWGPAVELRFPDFTRWAAARDAQYHLGATSRQVRRLYFRLAALLDQEPLPLGDGFVLTGNDFREATRGALYSDLAFPDLATLWQAVNEQTGGPAAALLRRLAPASFPEVPPDNMVAALFGVVCDDARWPRSVERYIRDVRRDSRRYPVAGGMAANIWPCAFWPVAPRERPVPITDRGPHNILIPQNLRDPATPLVGALGLRAALGRRARMVVADAGGHGVYLLTGNACADAATTRFLVSGRLPRGDLRCPATDPETVGAASQTLRKRAVDELRRRQAPLP
jgi:pimeloyl-ACP methyl ester carboxylesterase